MGKSAVVFGATGLVGRHLLGCLLNDTAYSRIIVVTRKPIDIEHAKIQQVISDFNSIESVKDELVADCFFCCLGTTRRNTPDLDRYYEVDHDYPVWAAHTAKAAGAKTFVLVSAVGANPGSANFYIKMKGETERDVIAAGVERTYIFRPSLLTGHRDTPRVLERVASALMSAINPLLMGKLSRFRSIPAAQLANAMVASSHHTASGVIIYHWKEIKRWQ